MTTVAELLAKLDARHEVHWSDYIGRPCQARLDGAVIVFTWGASGRIPCGLRPSDLGRPAVLVEVTS